MEKNELLPIGSVVYLKKGIIPLMIVSRKPIVRVNDKECYLDYAVVNQLTGLVNIEEFAYFNQEDISNILYEGFISENEKRTIEALREWRNKNKHIPKGKVTEMVTK